MSVRGVKISGLLLGTWLVLHLSIATVSASNHTMTKIFGSNGFSRAVVLYQYLTGTGNCFGFFAPGVISQIQISYDLKKAGAVVGQGFIGSDNPEVSLRLHNLTQQFWNASKKNEIRRAMAASFAGRLLSDKPEADEVSIILKAYVLPSMMEYRGGMRPSWETGYVGTFKRNGGA